VFDTIARWLLGRGYTVQFVVNITDIDDKIINRAIATGEDWNAISETLHLLSVPGMRESIKEGLKQDLSESSKKLDW